MAHNEDWNERQRFVGAQQGGERGEPAVHSSPAQPAPTGHSTQTTPPQGYPYGSGSGSYSDANTTTAQPLGLSTDGYNNNTSSNYNNYYASPVSPASQWAPGGDIGAQFASFNAGDNGQQTYHHVSPELPSASRFSGGVMSSPPPVSSPQPQQPRYQYQPPSTFETIHESPIPPQSTTSARPKPSPLQFDDSNHANIYASPGLSTGSTSTPYASYFQRGTHRTDSEARLLHQHHPQDAPATTGPQPTWAQPPQSTPPPYATTVLGPPPPRKRWFQLRQAWVMYMFFTFGLLCAAGHHIFYKSLNGKPANDQLTMLRYGTVLAFAAKAGFVACIVTAFRQRIWATVRNKILSVAAIDSLFAATEDVVALFNLETYQKASIAMLLALVAWLTPLVIILTSNTLVVELAKIELSADKDHTMCPGIRTLNFTQEETEEWRNATKINGLNGISLNTWNTTLNSNKPDEQGWYDYYTGGSTQFTGIATLSTLSQQAMSAKNASMEICGSGWNCTYSIKFTAPGYKCTELASGVGQKPKKLGNHTTPFGTEILLPEGNHSYYAYATGGEYEKEQFLPVAAGGIPLHDNGQNQTIIPIKDLPPHLGALRTEPVIWLGYSIWNDPNKKPPDNNTYPDWKKAFTPKIVACEHYVTNYEVDFKFNGREQTNRVTKREFLNPVIDTVYDRSVNASDGTHDNTTAYPQANYVLPINKAQYRRTASFHSLGFHLRKYVNGTVISNPVSLPIANTDALQTKLLDPTRDFFPYANVPELVQELYEDIILSLFSYQQFLAVVWAAKPDTKSGATTTGPLRGLNIPDNKDKSQREKDKQVDPSTLYPCSKSRYENQYKYVERDLWIVYAAAMLCALVAMVLGTLAVLENEGVLRNTKFSSIVAATRGPALEKVRWREDSRGDITPDVKRMRVGYGVVHHQSSPLSGGGGPNATTGLGVNNNSYSGGYNVMMDDFAQYPRQTTMSPEQQQGAFGGSAGEEVRYGFGLEGDVRQARREARRQAREARREGSMFRGR